MKKNLRMMIILAALGVIFSCAVTGFAQKKPLMLGGYKVVSVTDEGVVAAADFAVSDQGEKQEATIEVGSIVKAERQSVQGTNYRLCLQVNIADGNSDEPYEQFVKVIVYRNLKNEFKLTSWVEEDCGESE